MIVRGGQLTFSPSDLIRFSESPFASWMDRFYATNPGSVVPDERSADLALAAAHGDAHEKSYLARLRAEGQAVWQPPADDEPFEATAAAIAAGHPILFQAALRRGDFAGHADFLIRSDEGVYEVLDTKLARKPKPYFLIQLCAYAEMLETIQGVRPKRLHIVGGDNKQHTFRTDDYFFYYLAVKEAFLAMHAAFDPDVRATPDARADHGRWQSHADKILDALDHLSRVAGISRGQIDKLTAAGVTTLEALARTSIGHVRGIDDAVFGRLHAQARLQLDSRGLDVPRFEIIVPSTEDQRRGLAQLPPASKGDVYFDMEGYPYAEGGLEYLFGSIVCDGASRGGPLKFVDFWACDKVTEKEAFEKFVDWVFERFRANPSMHIYHYAPYEVTALCRLASTYATREEEVDALLRAEAFVDLYRIVRQGLRVGTPSYSLKCIEHLYRGKRQGDVSTAGQSVVEFARWLEERDGEGWETSSILRGIRDYNRDDCESTYQLAEWLRRQQAEAAIASIPPPPQAPAEDGSTSGLFMRDDELLQAQLRAAIPMDRSADPERWRVQELLAFLVTFHRREDKPYWRWVFDRLEDSEEDLKEDPDCLAGLVRTKTEARKDARSMVYEYRFDPEHETKVDAGQSCYVTGVDGLVTVTVSRLDLDNGIAEIRVGPGKPTPPKATSLIPATTVSAKKIQESIARTAGNFAATGELQPALRTVLHREAPSIAGVERGAPLPSDPIAAIANMTDTTLVVQGPPGAGKTSTGAAAILALVARRQRVGVMSNSHKAIEKLMCEVATLARRLGTRVTLAKVGAPEDEIVVAGIAAHASNVEDAVGLEADVIGGTAWTFSPAAAVRTLDYLFVDEAGQVSLANLVGVAPAANNIVLLGDQMQLSQPTQGTHPHGSGQSVLDYLLQGRATVAENEGVFLARTWRLHPDICSFISGAFYEDRLDSEACAAQRRVRASAAHPDAPETGIVFVPVSHEDNCQSCEEEADVIEALIGDLLERDLVQSDGTERRITRDDILIVAPYNLQVRLLKRRLPSMQVGTVDKFQGQQAAVVILSMCASEGQSSARGIDFLFSPNRLNVALSRAQCLAFVVGSPALAQTRAASVSKMKLVNLFCRLARGQR